MRSYRAMPVTEVNRHPLQLRGKGAHGIMMKNNTRTTVRGITMHNVGVFFIIDWTGDGNTVRPQGMGLAVLHCGCQGWCKAIACKRRLLTLSRRSTDNIAMAPFPAYFQHPIPQTCDK